MTFDQWWELQGCRTIGDPQDYARAAWDAENKNHIRLDDVIEKLQSIEELLDALEARCR